MSFDQLRFQQATLAPRQETVWTRELASFFAPGVDPVFTVRGLTGEELARANDIQARQQRLAAHIDALSVTGGGDAREALRSLLGYGDDVPEELAKRLDYLVYGCVEPAMDRPTAVKLFAAYPIIGYTLTNKILNLTGLGADVGKAPPSTPTPPS